jgi:hypothetical protein
MRQFDERCLSSSSFLSRIINFGSTPNLKIARLEIGV